MLLLKFLVQSPHRMSKLNYVDFFRRIPSDFARTSRRGQILTLVCYVYIFLAVCYQIISFNHVEYHTEVVINPTHGANIFINFDVTMHHLPCQLSTVVVNDVFGREAVQAREKFHYVEVDQLGRYSGKVYEGDEINLVSENIDLSTGCQIQGVLEVPRVPGHFSILPTSRGNRSLDQKGTNVSHTVHHFGFSSGKNEQYVDQHVEQMHLPTSSLYPLDKRMFAAERTHEAPHHFVSAITTRIENLPAPLYQLTHNTRIASIPADEVPYARFTYEISPMMVSIVTIKKHWYEGLTNLFALLGGTYTAFHCTDKLLT